MKFSPIPGVKYKYDYVSHFNDMVNAGNSLHALNNIKLGLNNDAKAILRKLIKNDLFFMTYFVFGMTNANHPWIVERCFEVEEKEAVCPLCGGMLNSVGECVVCGNKQSEGSAGTDKDSVIMNFAELGGVGESKAELLYASGYRNLDELQKASVNDLTKIDGISEKLAKNIRREVRKIIRKRKKSKVKDSKGMSQWLKGSDESFAGWLGNGARRASGRARGASR